MNIDDSHIRNIENDIKQLVSEKKQVSVDKIDPGEDLTDLGLDSLDVLELVMQIEMDFEVEISDTEVQKLHCCEDIVEFLKNKENNKVQ